MTRIQNALLTLVLAPALLVVGRLVFDLRPRVLLQSRCGRNTVGRQW
jgi:hypothetical protein